MSDKIYPKGIAVFSPRQGAPDFVKGDIIITPNDLIQWLKENPNVLKDYNGKKQLRLSLKDGSKGLYAEVNTYEKTEKTEKSETDLPF